MDDGTEWEPAEESHGAETFMLVMSVLAVAGFIAAALFH